MPVTVKQWVGEPIIILKPDAQVSLQDLIDAWFLSSEIAQTIEGTSYRVVDLHSTSAPDRVVSMILTIAKGIAGTSVDPLLNVAFVALSRDRTEGWFETLEDALNHIRALAGAPSISP